MVLKVGGMGSIYKVVGISRGGGKFSPRGSTKLSEFHFMGTFRVFILAIFTIMINSNNIIILLLTRRKFSDYYKTAKIL